MHDLIVDLWTGSMGLLHICPGCISAGADGPFGASVSFKVGFSSAFVIPGREGLNMNRSRPWSSRMLQLKG